MHRQRTTGSLPERVATSVPSLFDAVEGLIRDWYPDRAAPQEIWFRGSTNGKYDLVPGLYRAEAADLRQCEDSLFERFKLRARPHTSLALSSEWDWYFIGQHHGLPTRLLDWTESLTTAAYFALAPAIEGIGRTGYLNALRGVHNDLRVGSTPAIWILEAGTLNAHSTARKSDAVVIPGGPTTQRYLPSAIGKQHKANRHPLAILAPHSNLRIAAQQGAFTLHGWDPTPLQQLAQQPTSAIKLGRVLLDRSALVRMWSELRVAGVHRLALFPELDAVAHYCKWDT